jgi:predicted nuclease of predicted toxin-antitoxin system
LRFLLDENIPKRIKDFLESSGYAFDYSPKGLKNRELASLAISRECILVTRDKDFANTNLYPPNRFHGIIVLDIHPPRAEKLIKEMSSLLANVKSFEGKLLVVKEGEVETVE